MPAKKRTTSPISSFFYSKLFLLGIFAFIGVLAFGYGRALYQDYKIQQEINALKEEIQGMQHRRLESLDMLEYVLSDSYVDKQARTSLNLKAPGEHVLVFTDAAGGDSSELSTPLVAEDLSNPMKWWYYFTHKSLPE